VSPLAGKVILVVDDELGYREVLADEFNMAGATVLTAESGSKAIEHFNQHKIDAIISDIRMPNGDGIEFLDRVKTINAKIPVFMLITGYSDLSNEDAYDKGAEALFSKPCNLDDLINAVQQKLLPEEQRWQRQMYSVTTKLVVELKAPSIAQALQARVLNIGRGGMFLCYEGSPIDIETSITFSLRNLDSNLPIFEGVGICRWFRHHDKSDLPNGVGIEFTQLEEQSLQTMQKMLSENLPMAFIPKNLS